LKTGKTDMADRKKILDTPEWVSGDTKDHSRIISIDHTAPCLDTARLHQLEQAFRKWAMDSPRADVRVSRLRLLITFLLIRYACRFAKELGGPEAIRRARAVELMQGNLPLPAVQKILGHTSAGLTSAYVTFSESEIQDIARKFMEKESGRRTSARNAFFCKVTEIVTGDIQTRVEMITMDGHPVVTVITNDSVHRLGLVPGKWIVAEVKAPMVMLQDGTSAFKGSAENRFKGTVTRITRGNINTECIIRVSDTTHICAVMSSSGTWLSRIRQGDPVWAFFSCFSVVIHLD
jgi:molybdate transport system regulatory protein